MPELDLAVLAYNLAIFFPVFLFSLSVHEAAHAISARWGGDLTSAYQGRVTLNPIAHIDPVGTLLVPIIGSATGFPLVGWAKPVPVNTVNFRRGRKFGMVVAMAGPFSNVLIALFTVPVMQLYLLAVHYLDMSGVHLPVGLHRVVLEMFSAMILINLALMFFNMMPIPPLDGSHLLWHLYVEHRPHLWDLYENIHRFSYVLLIALMMTGVFGFGFRLVVVPLFEWLMWLVELPIRLVLENS